MCFGAGKACAAKSYAVNDDSPISTGCTQSGTMSARTDSSGVTADKYTAVPLSSNGRFAAFFAPESIPAQPSNGVGDVFLTITPF